MGRYNGTLHKLVDSASASNSKTKWNQVLHYLEGHTISNKSVPNPEFDSPLPPYSTPSSELEAELFDQQGPKKEDTPLKIAIKNAPAAVVAALCHLGQEAAKLADGRDRLPIHWACRRSPDDEDTEKVIKILVKAAPETLLHRDEGGRTPLHWLFWYHAPSRSASLVKFLCQELPDELFHEIRQPRDSHMEKYPLPDIPIPDGRGLPANASVIPDSRHGAIPLHYAVMGGASKEAMKMLISQYPNSTTYGDRKGRTPLAWYLGAGHLMDSNKRHVCGEANDPNATPWWHAKLSPGLIQLLISSKVARIVDDMGRTPLHWACHFYARSNLALGSSSLPVKAVQILVDNNIEATVAQDMNGRTPLHVLFSVVAEQQEQDYQRLVANRIARDDIDLVQGGPAAFKPSKELIELLLKSPDSDGQDQGYRFDPGRDEKKPAAASCVEDMKGLLPLHNALRVATEPEIVQILIQSNPTSLIHASEEELQTPLIQAFASEYNAPLQPLQSFELLMAAYVTSRHGTFIDGRVSLKMEDTSGNYPLHYACRFQASTEIIRSFVEKFPHCAVHLNAEGDLPIHCLLSEDCLFHPPRSGLLRGATLARNFEGLQTEKEIALRKQVLGVYREKIKILIEPLRTEKYLKIGSSAHGMTPLHIAVAFAAVPYTTLYRMVDTYPDAASALTKVKGHELSCMDLHEQRKEDAVDVDEWGAVRELLFAFNPRLDGYRKNDEVLDACVQLIRNEIAGKGSYHLQQLQGNSITIAASLELKDTLSSLDVPEIDVAYRPKSRKKKPDPAKKGKKPVKKKQSPSMTLAGTFSFGNEKKVEKSIYDDDLDDRYVVSPENSMEDDDDDDFLSSEGEEEEYYSDEESGSESEEGTSFDQSTNKSSWDRGLSSGPSGTYTDSAASQRSAISRKSGTSSPSKVSSVRSWKNSRRAKSSPSHVEEKKEDKPTPRHDTDIILSDVAMRIWCFFLLYNDPKNPDDNYSRQVEAVIDELDFDILEKLISWSVPKYAEVYLEQGTSILGVTLGDVASPTSKAIFKGCQYFLGKYEFPTELDGMLLHRNSDGNTVYVRAIEHVIRTEEYLPKQQFAPGEAEETIWATGEKVEEEGGYNASKFVDKKRTVCFKLTKNQEAYDNEVKCRKHLGLATGEQTLSNILPLFDSFNGSSDNKKGRRYLIDVNDERFQILNLFGGESIRLSDYPYALIYPYSEEGDLFDFFFHHGLNGLDDISEIGRQIASALKILHEKGVVHGNISMRHVNMVPVDDEAAYRTWAVSDLSTATRSQNDTAFMGTISDNGSAQFKTGLLPPEMFVKLSAAEARIYQTYWEMVERVYKVKVDKKVVQPFVNLQTGATYALRCHFVPSKDSEIDVALPELPYQLVAARESTDVWCFGLILFTLCSGGRPLFPSNLKTGHLLDYESIVSWNHEKAAAQVYEHVQDSIAQDLLLHLLSPFDDRVQLSMEIVLSHPFFNRSADVANLLGRMIDKRQHESAAYDRQRQKVVSERSDDNWLDCRTTSVECWNFDLLRKFNFSSTEIVSRLLGQRTGALSMPCNFILLPYKLSAKNKKAKLAPTTKKDVERAERMGVLLLSLGKACFFACQMKGVIEKSTEKQWTASKLLEDLDLPDGDFKAVKDDFMKIAATQIEAFRSNPVSALLKLIERRIAEIRKFFKDAGKAFLYLVDEYSGIPLVGSAYAPYPLAVAESIIDKFLVRALPFMHISIVYARGVSGGVSGLVRLIFEAAYPHVPPSWASAASGLPHVLDESLFINEISILREAITLVYSTKANYLADDLRFVRDSCLKIDTRGTFADMQRVVSSGSSLWTTKEGAAEIQESCKAFGFRQALQIQASLENQLTAQEQQLKDLQAEVERLRFRKDLDLDVPENSHSTRRMSNVSPQKVASTPKADVNDGEKETSAAKDGEEKSPVVNDGEKETPVVNDGAKETPAVPEKSIPPSPKVVISENVANDENEETSAVPEPLSIAPLTRSSPKTMSTTIPSIVTTPRSAPPVSTAAQGTPLSSNRQSEVPNKDAEPAPVPIRSPTASASPTETSAEEFYDSKENSSIEILSFDENRKPVEATNNNPSKEERDADGSEDVSICKSDTESLREVMSLD